MLSCNSYVNCVNRLLLPHILLMSQKNNERKSEIVLNLEKDSPPSMLSWNLLFFTQPQAKKSFPKNFLQQKLKQIDIITHYMCSRRRSGEHNEKVIWVAINLLCSRGKNLLWASEKTRNVFAEKDFWKVINLLTLTFEEFLVETKFLCFLNVCKPSTYKGFSSLLKFFDVWNLERKKWINHFYLFWYSKWIIRL